MFRSTAIFGLSFLFVFLILAALYGKVGLALQRPSGDAHCGGGRFCGLAGAANGHERFQAESAGHADRYFAAKNAILIVNFARIEYEKRQPLLDATLRGRPGSPPPRF